MRPVDVPIFEKDLEFLDHLVVVRGAVRGDTIDFFENVVFFQDSHELCHKIDSRMFPMHLTKIQQRFNEVKSFVDVVTSNS